MLQILRACKTHGGKYTIHTKIMIIYTQRKKSLHGDSDTNYILLKRDLRPQELAGVSNASG
jgi:hypothetical protein